MDNDFGLTQLGNKITEPSKNLETFPAPQGISSVVFSTSEFTCNCPITHAPDLYTLTIEYVPSDRCLESKSLKLYAWSFRDQGKFAEQLAVEIRDDLIEALNPQTITVTLEQSVRGGFTLKVISSLIRFNQLRR